MARVADVVLNRCADSRLELVGVEVGFGAVLRRLRLRRLASHAGEDVVAWTDLHLTSERGHAVQLATPRSAVHHLDAAGLAALISRLDIESATEVLAVREPHIAADAVRTAHPAVGERILRAMPGEATEHSLPPCPSSTQVAGAPASRTRRCCGGGDSFGPECGPVDVTPRLAAGVPGRDVDGATLGTE